MQSIKSSKFRDNLNEEKEYVQLKLLFSTKPSAKNITREKRDLRYFDQNMLTEHPSSLSYTQK